MSQTVLRQITIDFDEHLQWSVSINGVPQEHIRRFAIDLSNELKAGAPYYVLERFLYSPLPDSTISQGEGTTMK